MIPILYESTETVFTSNGLGRLADTIDCKVKRSRNGIFECEFIYPMNGPKFKEIKEGRIIAVTHDETGKTEPFDIYGHSAPTDGKVTFYAHHISYRLGGVTVKPFTATSCADALAKLKANSINANPFSFWTDKAVSKTFTLTQPRILKEMLGGVEGSILDVFGTGEYDFTRFDVKLYTRMGTDTDVSIRYGKNLIDLKEDVDFSDSYNGIVPFWAGQTEEGEDVTVTLPEWVLYKTGTTWDGRNNIIPYDFSGDFESEPTVSELRAKAQSFIDNNDPRLPLNTLTVDFVQLWQTEEYRDFAPLQKVGLCDTVKVIFSALGIDTRLKVVETEYDVLNDRYSKLTLGDAPQTYAEVITDRIGKETALNTTLIRWVQGWATNALKIANDTSQYFWFTGTGTDTGAHITEVPREEFLADPTNGGGNLLARSNGIAIRLGLLERAVFGANGARIGLEDEAHATMTDRRFQLQMPSLLFTDMGILNGNDGTVELIYKARAGSATNISTNNTHALQIVDAVYEDGTAADVSLSSDGYTFIVSNRKEQSLYITYTTDTPCPVYTFGTRESGQTVGVYSVADGFNNVAAAFYSSARGKDNKALSYNASANGDSSQATGVTSHADGLGAVAQGMAQTAIGLYNVIQGDTGRVLPGSLLFVVGNGTGDANRKSAFGVLANGNAVIQGSVYVSCNDDLTSGHKLKYTQYKDYNLNNLSYDTGYEGTRARYYTVNCAVDGMVPVGYLVKGIYDRTAFHASVSFSDDLNSLWVEIIRLNRNAFSMTGTALKVRVYYEEA